jgi:hypothetical protein
MKREAALQALSRDHHQTLVLAQKLQRADEATRDGVRESFLEYWLRAGWLHFREEEEILLPAFAAYGDPHHPLVAQVLCEHIAFRARVDALARNADASVSELRELGEVLADHIRLEERELFPLIERTLPEPAMAALATALADREGNCGNG